MNEEVIPYGRQNITEDDIRAVIATLKSDFLTQGPEISRFEDAFAKYTGSKYAVAVSNGTAALHLCAMVLKVDSSSNVITTPITFAATANCIRYCGGNVFFADIDPNTWTLDIEKVKELILSKPKGFFSGIITVDLAGYPVNLEAFRELAGEHGLWLLQDACHSPGGFFTDSKNIIQSCGNSAYANLAIFSFHPVKHIACGEGGMIVTNDENLYKELLLLRTHGITKDQAKMEENHGGWYYEMQELGYNYRLTEFQASLGLSQLNRAEQGLARRREIAKVYADAFRDKPYITGQSGSVEGHAYHLYIIRTADRKGLYNFLKENKVYCQVHYIPVHLLPYYKCFGWEKGDFPQAEKYYDECLSLPMFPTLTDKEQQHVIDLISRFFASK
jgi:UDP-4-amino-4,6-dideoxy-N-acetyl-beta-L-altrosamine transaminase